MDNLIDIQMMYMVIMTIDISYYLNVVYKNDINDLKLV
jgi:hypothetical protein